MPRSPTSWLKQRGTITFWQTFWISVVGGLLAIAIAPTAGAWVGTTEIKAGAAVLWSW